MNKDQVKGRVEEAKGKIKETTCKAVGNSDLEAEGIGSGDARELLATLDVVERASGGAGPPAPPGTTAAAPCMPNATPGVPTIGAMGAVRFWTLMVVTVWPT